MRKLRNITKPGSSLYICVGEGVLRDFTLDFTVSNVQRRTKCRIFTRMTKFFVLFCKKGLTAQRFCGILIKLEIGITIQYLGVAQLVARYLGVVEAAGSSPVTQTKTENQTVLRFFFVFLLFPLFFEIRASDFRARIFRFFTPKKRSKTIGRKNKWQASQKSRTALIW